MESIVESIISKQIIFHILHCKVAEVKWQVIVKVFPVRPTLCLSIALQFHSEIKLKLKFILHFKSVHEILIQHVVIP
jgi:hypothetical protein